MNKSGGTEEDCARSAAGPGEKGKGADGEAPAACRSDPKVESAGEQTVSEIDKCASSAMAQRQSLEFAQQLLTGIHDGIVAYDRYLRYTIWNPFMEELTGLSASEVVGNNPLDLFPSLRSQGVYTLLERALEGESFSAVEQHYFNPGTWQSVWISGRLSPLRDSAGEIIGVVGTVFDITDRKREEAVVRNHSMLRAVVEGATDAVFVKDLRGCYLMINSAGAQFLGKSVAEVLGKDDRDLFPSEEAVRIMEGERIIMESGAGRTLEEVSTAGGSTRTYLATKWPWRDVRGNVIGLIGLLRNVTEHRRAEEAVRQSKRSYETLVNSIDGIVWEADPQTLQFAFVSKQAERLLGYPVERWLNEPAFWSDHLHPDDREWAVRALTEAVIERRSQDLVYRMIAADWRTIWLRDIVTVAAESGEAVKLRGVMVDVTRHKEADQALAATEERLRAVVASVPIVLFSLDRFGVFTLSEGRGLEVLGVTPGSAVGQSVFERYSDNSQITNSFRKALLGETFASTVEVCDLVFDAWCGPLRDESGEVGGVIGVAIDVTEYKRAEASRNSLEQQLFQAQKMESLGRLAAGVAHDFNNVLTAIIGYGQLVLAGLGKGHRLRKETEEILEAGYRGASLTRQLLALGRRQALVRKNTDINDTIATLSRMLGRVIGEDVELCFIPGTNLPAVNADPGQIEQVLMNLAVNARDAMPSGGRLIMETRQAQLEEDYCLIHPWARPGKYVQISISDTGEGMDSETQARIFEPFFTTKEQDKGTGLGLAVVYGIVEQHQGLLHVYSQVGFGTAFNVYLPISDAPVDEVSDQAAVPLRGGTETVLLAEDDSALRELARRSLQKLGYRILLAENGEEAVRIYKTNQEQIDLLVLDWVMPKMSGLDAYKQIRAGFGDITAMFVTGYSPQIVNTSALPEGVTFLHKPYGLGDLGRRVREVLDQTGIERSKA